MSDLRRIISDLGILADSADQDASQKNWSNYEQYMLEYNQLLAELHAMNEALDRKPIAAVPPGDRGAYGIVGASAEQAKMKEVAHCARTLSGRYPTDKRITSDDNEGDKGFFSQVRNRLWFTLRVAFFAISLTATVLVWIYESIRLPNLKEENQRLTKQVSDLSDSLNLIASSTKTLGDRAGRISGLRIYCSSSTEDYVGAIRLEVENHKYDLLTSGYVSYEVAQLVALTALPPGERGFSVDDIINSLDDAASKFTGPTFRANMIEIAGNLGIMRRSEYPKIKQDIVDLIRRIQDENAGRSPYVDELSRVKLAILEGNRRSDLRDLLHSIQTTSRVSFYEEGIFEQPEYWLPFVVAQPDLGDARFYAAYLLRTLLKGENQDLAYQIRFLVRSERLKGKLADQDVINELEAGL